MKLTRTQIALLVQTMREDKNIKPTMLSKVAGVSLSTAKNYLRRREEVLNQEIGEGAESNDPVRISEIVSNLQRAAKIGAGIILKQLVVMSNIYEEDARAANGDWRKMKLMKPDEIKAMANALSGLVQQSQLLQGKPTSISSVMDASPEQLDLLLQQYLERASEGDPDFVRLLGQTQRLRVVDVVSVDVVKERTEPEDDGFDGLPDDPNDGYPGISEEQQ